jgi:hypothetical protein
MTVLPNGHSPMKTIAILGAGLAALILTGCQSSVQYVKFPTQKKAIEDKSKARIYVVRTADSKTHASVEIIDDRTLVGMTAGAGYLCWERKPGEMALISNSKNRNQIPLKVNAGEVYFVLQHVEPAGRFNAKSSLEIVNRETAELALRNCPGPLVLPDAQLAPKEPLTQDHYGGIPRAGGGGGTGYNLVGGAIGVHLGPGGFSY